MPKQDLPDDGSDLSLSAIPDLLPRLDCPFEIEFQALSDRLADVPDEANGLLKLLDGRRTLREALVAAQDAMQAAAAARDLSALGVIHPVPAAPGVIAGESGTQPPMSTSAQPAATSVASMSAAGAAAPLANRGSTAIALAVASASAVGAPPSPPRIVRFPARRKRLPPPPGRLGGGGSGALPLASSTNGGGPGGGAAARVAGVASESTGWAAGDADPARRRAPGGVEGATSGWRGHGWVAALVIAGALAVALSALVFMYRS